ncbi:MAG: oxidoreductase, partial [Acidobacteriota bacterium]
MTYERCRSRLPALLTAALASAVLVGCGGAPAPPSDSPDAAEAAPGVSADAAETANTDVTCEPWVAIAAETTASFRGVSAVDDSEVWVSGTEGTVGRSTDGGESFAFQTVPGAEALDFRDIDAFAGGVAYALSAGPGDASQIYKTADGGETWTRQFVNTAPEGFLDGMAFWDADRGLAYGDPVDGAFFILRTADGGDTWTRVSVDALPAANDGEAGFAASGTGLAVDASGLALFGTGGATSRVFRSVDFGETWSVVDVPLLAGESSQGTFSIAIVDADRAVAVGGDFQAPEAADGNAAFSLDGGATWQVAASAPGGYRSAVV